MSLRRKILFSSIIMVFSLSTAGIVKADSVTSNTIAVIGGSFASGTNDVGLFGLQLNLTTTQSVTAVSEPATLALAGANLLGLWALRRRRNRNKPNTTSE